MAAITAYGSPGYSSDQNALLSRYPVLRLVARLMRVTDQVVSGYSPQGKLLLAQILDAAALCSLICQVRAQMDTDFAQWTTGQLWVGCSNLASAVRATAYQGSGTGVPTLTPPAQQLLSLFQGIDMLTMPTTPSDFFGILYLPQTANGIPTGMLARVDLLAALMVILASIRY